MEVVDLARPRQRAVWKLERHDAAELPPELGFRLEPPLRAPFAGERQHVFSQGGRRAYRLADQIDDELHALMNAAGAEVQDLLRQGFRLTSLIGAVAFMLWAIWLLLFATNKFSWVWPPPLRAGCKK